jgi:hypothetical protein
MILGVSWRLENFSQFLSSLHYLVRIMDSEVDLSFPISSTTQNSIEIGFKILKDKSAYTIWIYIRAARDGKNSRLKFYIYYIEI